MVKNIQFSKDFPIAMVTAYDAPTARLAESVQMDIILVGDSLGPNMLGYDSVNQVTVADICHHTAAVRRGAPHTHIMADLPWEAVESNSPTVAAQAAAAIIASGADSIKVEIEHGRVELLTKIVSKGIPVCAHVGYTPQSPDLAVTVQGKDFNRACEIIELARISEMSGAFMILMELIPAELAQLITDQSSLPTIGIGAGPHCTGQVQVIYDITGFSSRLFRHAKLFADSATPMKIAFSEYRHEVHARTFPTSENCSTMNQELLERISVWSKINE